MPDATAAVQSTSDSYFVMGVEPHNMMLLIDDGVHTLPLHEYGQSQGDYILVKAEPSARLMLRQAAFMVGHSMFGRAFRSCSGPRSFPLPAGKVVYVTNLDFVFSGAGQVSMRHHQDFAGASEYIAAHYPQLAGKMEQGVVNFPPSTPCF